MSICRYLVKPTTNILQKRLTRAAFLVFVCAAYSDLLPFSFLVSLTCFRSPSLRGRVGVGLWPPFIFPGMLCRHPFLAVTRDTILLLTFPFLPSPYRTDKQPIALYHPLNAYRLFLQKMHIFLAYIKKSSYLCTRNVLTGDCGRALMPAAHSPQQSITLI